MPETANKDIEEGQEGNGPGTCYLSIQPILSDFTMSHIRPSADIESAIARTIARTITIQFRGQLRAALLHILQGRR